jgi:hypothetical protein
MSIYAVSVTNLNSCSIVRWGTARHRRSLNCNETPIEYLLRTLKPITCPILATRLVIFVCYLLTYLLERPNPNPRIDGMAKAISGVIVGLKSNCHSEPFRETRNDQSPAEEVQSNTSILVKP